MRVLRSNSVTHANVSRNNRPRADVRRSFKIRFSAVACTYDEYATLFLVHASLLPPPPSLPLRVELFLRTHHTKLVRTTSAKTDPSLVTLPAVLLLRLRNVFPRRTSADVHVPVTVGTRFDTFSDFAEFRSGEIVVDFFFRREKFRPIFPSSRT